MSQSSAPPPGAGETASSRLQVELILDHLLQEIFEESPKWNSMTSQLAERSPRVDERHGRQCPREDCLPTAFTMFWENIVIQRIILVDRFVALGVVSANLPWSDCISDADEWK